MKRLLLLLLVVHLIGCKPEVKRTLASLELKQHSLINSSGTTIKSRFNTPRGYQRIALKEDSFAHYLQNFTLKGHGSKVHLYNGALKNRQDVHEAVLDIDVGIRDLQQCADATMRLRAEFLFKQARYTDIHFNFTNGFKADYKKWQQGQRIAVTGTTVKWYQNAAYNNSKKSFSAYLTMVFSYAGTLSLEKEMLKVNTNDMQIGDVFIKGGSPGHAVIVMDLAKNNDGESVFLLAQSYMPAQEIHVLKNLEWSSNSPWYSLKDLQFLNTPEWQFSKEDLRRFQ